MGRGNPNIAKLGEGTRFSEKNQPNQYRKPSILTIVKKKLFDEGSRMKLRGVDLLDDDGNITGKKVNVSVKLNNAEALALRYQNLAMSDSKVLIDLINRIDGKPNQYIEVGASKSEIEQQSDVNDMMSMLSPETQALVLEELRQKMMLEQNKEG